MNRINYFFFFFIFCVAKNSLVLSQVNVLGKPGTVFTPSAQWDTLRQFGVSFAHIPDGYAINNFVKILQGPEHIYGIRLPLTGFLEVNLNITRKPNASNLTGVGDRHIDIRFHLLNEKTYFPSIVLVVSPPEGESTFLSQDLIVATKNVAIGDAGTLRVSGGYSSPYFYRTSRINRQNRGFRKKSSVGNYYLNGFFGSLQWQPWEFLGLMVEHDSHRINTGMFVQWKERIFLQGNLYGNKELGITTSVRFPIDFYPFELRRYIKKNDID